MSYRFLQIIICIMNQGGNSGQSQDIQSGENEYEPSNNERGGGERQRENEARENQLQSNEQVKKQHQRNLYAQQRHQQPKFQQQPIGGSAQNKVASQLKQKPKSVKDEGKKNQTSSKIRKKFRKSKSASSFSGDSFNSKQVKPRKRRGRRAGADSRRHIQSSIQAPKRQRGRQKAALSRPLEVKQPKQILDQPIKITQKANEKAPPLNKRVVQQNRNEPSLINMHWNNQKHGEEDFNSIEAQICEQSCNERHNSLTNRRITELVNQQGENTVKRVAELPIVYY